MKKLFWIILIVYGLFFSFESYSQSLNISGGDYKPITLSPSPSTGLNNIYVVWNVAGITLSYESSGSSTVEWLMYGNLGGGYSEPVANVVKSGSTYTLSNPAGNKGYIINDNGQSYYFWLVDYSSYNLNFGSLDLNEESGCEASIFNFKGSVPAIEYYSINGRKEILDREIILTYNNLVWDEGDNFFTQQEIVENLSYINNSISIIPPLYCSSEIHLSGDRFLKEWGLQETLTYDFRQPKAVDVKAIVENDASSDEESTQASNQIGGYNGELGGSAPYDAKFISFFTDAVVHYEWQLSKTSDFEEIEYRIYEQDLEYSFTEEGTTYIRFIGSNSDGSCEAISDTFTVFIGNSELKIPNAFSPNGDGINDVWKVAYRSLLEFKCWIFDRHGHQIFYFNNPDEGWDGKNGSKFVNPGVYFYVIEAKGADGKKYKKSGDINILKSYSTGNGPSIEE